MDNKEDRFKTNRPTKPMGGKPGGPPGKPAEKAKDFS